MIKIKLTTYNYSPTIRQEFLSHTPGGSGRWGEFQFFVNEPMQECDYWLVVDSVPEKESVLCPKANTIFFNGEPEIIKKYNKKFLGQFAKIITSQPSVQRPGVYHRRANHEWFPKKSFDELYGHDEVDKTKLISIVVSNKAYTSGHKKRLDFCLKLKERFGDKIDMFGRGTNPFEDKWSVLAPYKYSIAIENSAEPDYISEKLTDCFVCLAFPFYFGCPNVEDYYSKSSYELLDLDDFEKSCRIIKKIIGDEHHYGNHFKDLVDAKNKYLTKNFLVPFIADFIKKEYGNTVDKPKETVTLKPEKDFQKLKEATKDLKKFLVNIKLKIKSMI